MMDEPLKDVLARIALERKQAGLLKAGETRHAKARAQIIDRAKELAGEPLTYFFQAGPYVKIGYGNNVLARLASCRVGCPLPMHLAAMRKGGREVERNTHARFAADRVHGEWFWLSADMVMFADRACLKPVAFEVFSEGLLAGRPGIVPERVFQGV